MHNEWTKTFYTIHVLTFQYYLEDITSTLSKYEAKIWCELCITHEKSPTFTHFSHSDHPFGAFYQCQAVQTTKFVYVEGIKNQKIIIEPIFVLAGKWRVWSTCILALFQTAVRKI